MSESAKLRRQELECLRLEADCMQLARAVDSPSMKAHFIQMAEKWSLSGGLGNRARIPRRGSELDGHRFELHRRGFSPRTHTGYSALRRPFVLP